MFVYPNQHLLINCDTVVFPIEIADHLGGFDSELRNPVLESLDSVAKKRNTQGQVHLHMPLLPAVRKKYRNLVFTNSSPDYIWNTINQDVHQVSHNFSNFLCSFNGSSHVSRKMLTAILHRFGWFNDTTCSKNFSFTVDELDGHLQDYVGENTRFYRKFFFTDQDSEFFSKINSFGYHIGHTRALHRTNIATLKSRLSTSFLHIVSETMATSYHPFVTEKFLYSVATRGLFLAYAQPGWHEYLETCYGFKKYNQLFDYKFDSIQNPVHRLVELMSMISKFSMLSTADWHDLYLIERDTIEHNYHHYVSKEYLKCVEKNLLTQHA